jgi:tetratricopeptide (TPR) repeat protein
METVCNNWRAMGPRSCFLVPAFPALVLAATSLLAQTSAQQSSAPQPSTKNNDALELVKQGQKLNSEGKQDEALALYDRALQLSPDLYQAQLATGIALDLEGKYQQARVHLAKAIAVATPEQKIQALRTMGVSYAFSREASEAAKYDQQAFDAQYQAKKFDDAAATANELARIYLESGDVDNAFQWYQTGHLTALLKPNMTPAEKDLWEFRWESAMARIRARQDRKEEAQKHLAASKALLDKGDNPDQTRFYPYIAGYVAFYGGDYKMAIAELEKGDQKDPFVLGLLAQACEQSGDKAKATEYYKQVLTINSHNPGNAFARPLAERKVPEKT